MGGSAPSLWIPFRLLPVSNTKVEVRRRRDGQATHRRVLDAVVRTILEVGYYKASSNEIARRAGVTWGAIQHLFGSPKS